MFGRMCPNMIFGVELPSAIAASTYGSSRIVSTSERTRRVTRGISGIAIATVIGIGIAILIGGVVVTESVYAIPGLGRLTVDAVLARDFPTIQGVILFFSLVYVLINLLIDLSYIFLDPRIRY